MHIISMKKVIVTNEEAGKRIDQFVTDNFDISKSQAKWQLENGGVFLNGSKPKKAGQMLKEGDEVEFEKIAKDPVVRETGEVENLSYLYKEIEVLSENENYLIVNKPAGLLVHPTMATEPYSLVAWLIEKYPELKGVGESEYRPGIVHRIDKLASGILVVARNQKTFEHLKSQFKKREVEKKYSVLVHGRLETDHDEINFPIDRGHDGKMVSRPIIEEVNLQNVNKIQPGKEARTEFWVKEEFYHYTYLDVQIHSGRTHQIRVHMHAYGHPVVGDQLYYQKRFDRKKAPELDRLFLHARYLKFTDESGNEVELEKEIPKKLQEYLKKIKPAV